MQAAMEESLLDHNVICLSIFLDCDSNWDVNPWLSKWIVIQINRTWYAFLSIQNVNP